MSVNMNSLDPREKKNLEMLISFLKKCEEPMTIREISEALHLHPQTVSKFILFLQNLQLVKVLRKGSTKLVIWWKNGDEKCQA